MIEATDGRGVTAVSGVGDDDAVVSAPVTGRKSLMSLDTSCRVRNVNVRTSDSF